MFFKKRKEKETKEREREREKQKGGRGIHKLCVHQQTFQKQMNNANEIIL